ncbi:bifunctional phosphoglucose/phosphomannose isomerase [Nonomuraea typhae]|uniref:Bifunctional phosphoglucose/phosphomannose isomerase n=1 Tax=Nonomuraea typhae TaxID=2603600 RepID=A0ABW7Z046_9ACTN
MRFAPERLDDQNFLTDADAGGMLLAVAASAAQVRTGYRAAVEAGLPGLRGRPRAIVVTGMGGSAIAGDILAAVAGNGAPLPILTVRSYQLPGWVGAADLVIAVSASGRTEETMSAATEAVRRGCSIVAVGSAGSPLESVARQGSGIFVPVPVAGQPRANVWLLAVPLLVAASALGLTSVDQDLVEGVAKSLEDIAHRCRPSSESFINPGKQLAIELAESIPMLWGASQVTSVAAYRLACQLNENAKYPAVSGELPEANHNQVVAFDGPLAERDLFADDGGRTLRLVMMRDADEHPQVTRRREASVRMAHDRNVRVTELAAEGAHPLERIASLIGLGDFASVYLALGYGLDPTPVTAITELKARISP